jgi:hypothetical protein
MLIDRLLFRKFIGFVVIFLSVAILAGCTAGGEGQLNVGESAPEFSASTADGQMISLSDYQNKQPVLLFFHMAVG